MLDKDETDDSSLLIRVQNDAPRITSDTNEEIIPAIDDILTDDNDKVIKKAKKNNHSECPGFFLRNMDREVLDMSESCIGLSGLRPICSSLCSNLTITCVNFTNCSIGDECVPSLCLMIKESTSITSLNLSQNSLTSRIAENLCDALASNPQLERLNMSRNLYDDKAAVYFAELMVSSLRLSHLNLSYNRFGDVAVAQFGRALPQATSLIDLDLSWNRLNKNKFRQLAKGLAENKYLKVLNLAANGIGPSNGCSELASALRNNKTLELLDLSNNRITPEGAVLLGKGFSSNTTLKCLKGNVVNQDFRDLQDATRTKLPDLNILAGRMTTAKTRAQPAKYFGSGENIIHFIRCLEKLTGNNFVNMLRALDSVGDGIITRQAFLKAFEKYSLQLTEEDMKQVLRELDPDNKEEINYKIFEQSLA